MACENLTVEWRKPGNTPETDAAPLAQEECPEQPRGIGLEGLENVGGKLGL